MLRPLLLALGLVFSGAALAQTGDEAAELAALAATPIYAPGKYYDRLTQAPASVSIITADDIRTFGWRTLGEILRSIRGVSVNYDTTYDYLGVRGFARPGDYNSGVALCIDGMRINDPYYEGGLIGTEFPLDVALIQRVEYIRGPGSAIYGGNALFGVINIVTRNGAALGGGELAVNVGSRGQRGLRVSSGKVLEQGGDLLLSASVSRDGGSSYYFPAADDAQHNQGRTTGTDFDLARRFFLKWNREGLALTAGVGQRRKGDPLPYTDGSVFNDRGNWDGDRLGFLNLAYRWEAGEGTAVLARLFAGDYAYRGHFLYPAAADGAPYNGYRQFVSATWTGFELQGSRTLAGGHQLVAGIEQTHVSRMTNHAYDDAPYLLYANHAATANRQGLYVQADLRAHETLLVTLGARTDTASRSRRSFSPRTGLIYQPASGTAVKVLFGRGTRNPSEAEALAGDGAYLRLRPERIHNRELTLEHYLGANTRLTVAAFHFGIHNLVVADPNGTYMAGPDVHANGVEAELDHVWAGGARWRGSVTRSRVREEDGSRPTMSPAWLGKLALSAPLLGGAWRVAGEVLGVSSQRSFGGRVPGYVVANLNLRWLQPGSRAEWSLGVYNLLDRQYTNPQPASWISATGGQIPQPGRGLRLGLSLPF